MMASGAEQEEVYTLLLTNIPVDSMLKVSVLAMPYRSTRGGGSKFLGGQANNNVK